MLGIYGFLAGLPAVALAATSPPSGALVVGSDGSYSTIQDAVNALDTSSTSEQIIFIQPGTYSEQVYIQEMSGPLSVYGYTDDEGSYSANQVTITAGHSQVSTTPRGHRARRTPLGCVAARPRTMPRSAADGLPY
jgi:pectinesterase